MRALCFLTVTLLTATASASPRTLPFEIVTVLPDTHQVLVLDKVHNTHLLLGVGSTFEDNLIVEINGIGVLMESNQEQFIVYPKAAKGLALELRDPHRVRLPTIYGKVELVPAPAAEDRSAFELVSLLAFTPMDLLRAVL